MYISTVCARNPRRVVGAAAAAVITCILLFAAFPIEMAKGRVKVPEEHGLAPEHQGFTPSQHDAMDSNSDDYRVLTSTRNTLGLYNTINVKKTGYSIMNPTLLELPRGSRHDFLVIARAPHVDKEINGTKYRLARQVAMFANLTYNRAQRPELTAGNWSKLLVQDFGRPDHHCKQLPDMDKYIGPEDMKLFWTRNGAPLLIFTHQVDDENLCEGMFLIDARAAVPELIGALGDHARKISPIRFGQPTGLRRQAPAGHEADARYQREKNWAPVQSPFSDDDDELLFMVEPSRMFRWASTNKPVQEMEIEHESAVEPTSEDEADDTTWHSLEMTCVHDVMMTDKHVHQSTPMLSLTLCDRGKCEPHEGNTVMLGMVQRRYDPPGYPFTWYDRRMAVYAAVPPYNMLSVSKKLTYHGEADGKYIWTGSMVYFVNRTDIPYNRNHGFLDDEVWLSFGIGDSAPGWLDIKAKDLVQDHHHCRGALGRHRGSITERLARL
ncbi:hypothetical protein B0J13DRAFT_664452 [Dactylonectria estremocensis]|uniref:Uncharacterized protein n=1 Tax=Dactylonectria estremocensis TaxID=1079267 RepID=A0A9P9EWS9_9HYPO|nr:hypothetical protein B0J13DRAFT_664452 [Dactylonectria estremocensis]